MTPTAKSSRHRSVAVALALGVTFQFVLDALYRYVSVYIAQLFFDVGNFLGLGEATLRAFVLTAGPACEAAILGVLFGLPLGLLVRRRVVGYWLLFVSVVVAMNVLTVVMSGSQIGWLFAAWIFPITWLNMLVILGVALVTARSRHPIGNLAPNAP